MTSFAPNIVLLGVLAVACWTDLRASRIPNLLTLPASVVGISFHAAASGLDGFFFGLWGWAAGVGLLFVPYLMSGMGAGDVKLMGAVGSFLGPQAVFEAFLASAVVGGLYAVILISLRREAFQGFFREKLAALYAAAATRSPAPMAVEVAPGRPRLRYGLAIALGTITYIAFKACGVAPLS
ncbi:MAG: A24 family peptidase [Desulfobacterales bacterium]